MRRRWRRVLQLFNFAESRFREIVGRQRTPFFIEFHRLINSRQNTKLSANLNIYRPILLLIHYLIH